jgi:hypothetical protein
MYCCSDRLFFINTNNSTMNNTVAGKSDDKDASETALQHSNDNEKALQEELEAVRLDSRSLLLGGIICLHTFPS